MEESCLIYVKPKGKLLIPLINNGVGYFHQKSKKTEEYSKDLINNSNTLMKMESLFDQCLNFISRNIKYLDSLEDFPSDIGKLIWDRALKINKLDDSVVSLFIDAYQSLIVSSLSINNNLLLLNNYEQNMVNIFTRASSLTKLNISNCSLGDHHDILKSIHRIQTLTHLNISSNNLSKIGLRNLILPYSLKNYTPSYIDLSGNKKLKPQDIKTYLNIEQIILSCGEEVESWKNCLKDKYKLMNRPEIVQFATKGWINDLIMDWNSRIIIKKSSHVSSINRERTEINSFYGKKLKTQEKKSELSLVIKDIKDIKYEFRLIKRKYKSINESPRSEPKKHKKIIHDEDFDIMKMYSN